MRAKVQKKSETTKNGETNYAHKHHLAKQTNLHVHFFLTELSEMELLTRNSISSLAHTIFFCIFADGFIITTLKTMANKRSLKKTINQICEELFTEAVAASLYGNEANKENTEALVVAIIKIHHNYISRVSHPEPGITACAYYKDLREKFVAQVSEIIDQINNL